MENIMTHVGQFETRILIELKGTYSILLDGCNCNNHIHVSNIGNTNIRQQIIIKTQVKYVYILAKNNR
jgi:hypothetical protein